MAHLPDRADDCPDKAARERFRRRYARSGRWLLVWALLLWLATVAVGAAILLWASERPQMGVWPEGPVCPAECVYPD